MDMVTHLAISPIIEARFLSVFSEKMKIINPIFIMKENRLPPIPTLDNMMRHIGNNDTSKARHARTFLIQISIGL